MATTDVSLIEFSAIPLLDPAVPIGPAWLVLVEDNVSGAVWRATTVQAKAIIAPAVVVNAQTAPVVSLALSANTGQLGTLITLTAQASSTSSTIAKVDFFDSGVKVGASVTTQPYQATYIPSSTGRHAIVAVATDANGTATTSASQFLDISALVVAPVIVSLNPIPPGSVGTALSLGASASVTGSAIAKVEFFDGASIVGVSTTSPYGCSYVPTTPGPHYFTAKATSSTGASAISPALSVQVVQPTTITNQPPSVSLSVTTTNFTLGGTTTLSALAADVDGSVVRVDFYDGTTLLSSQSSQGPYSFDYIPTKTGGHALSAKATDNLGSFTTASLNITVNAVAIAPSSPTNVVAALLPPSAFVPSYSVVVTWVAPTPNGSPAIGGYYVYRDGSTTAIASSATLTFTDYTVRAGEYHTYTVAAFSGILISPLSIAASITVLGAVTSTVPSAPSIIAVTASSSSSVLVSFAASSSNGGAVITGYNVYRGGVFLATTAPTATSYTDGPNSNLIASTTYVYTMVATNSVGPSPSSNSVSVITPQPAVVVTAPGAPTNVYGTASSNSVLLYFTAPANNGGATITGFSITRINAGISTLLTTAAGTATTYTDNGAVNGQTYTYVVAAINSAGTSPQTASAPVVMPVAPAVTYNTTLVGSASGPVLIVSGQPGAGIQLNSPGGADVLKFNSITGGNTLAQRMNVYIAGTQVAAVDIPAAYVGAGFSYTLAATGVTRSGIFANGAVTIQ